MRELIKSFQKGIGFGLGTSLSLVVVFLLALGVYAFVEPSSGPSSNYFYDTDSPIITNSTMQFVGYSAAVNGNRGGIDDAHDECNSLYPGSRSATYHDIIRLGPLYNYTYDIWLMSDNTGPSAYCNQFTGTGPTSNIIDSTGDTVTRSCSSAYRFACIKGN